MRVISSCCILRVVVPICVIRAVARITPRIGESSLELVKIMSAISIVFVLMVRCSFYILHVILMSYFDAC